MTHPTDQIEAYLTGGLTPQERAAFEDHVAGCPACTAAFDEATRSDAMLAGLFSSARPVPGFEDRVIQRLRVRPSRPSRPIVHPMVRRAAVGIAASLLLGGIGFVGTAKMDGKTGGFALFGGESARVKSVSNLRQIGLAMLMYQRKGNSLDHYNDQVAYGRRAFDSKAASTWDMQESSDRAVKEAQAQASSAQNEVTKQLGEVKSGISQTNPVAGDRRDAISARNPIDASVPSRFFLDLKTQDIASKVFTVPSSQGDKGFRDHVEFPQGSGSGFKDNPHAASGGGFGGKPAAPIDQYDSVLLPDDDDQVGGSGPPAKVAVAPDTSGVKLDKLAEEGRGTTLTYAVPTDLSRHGEQLGRENWAMATKDAKQGIDQNSQHFGYYANNTALGVNGKVDGRFGRGDAKKPSSASDSEVLYAVVPNQPANGPATGVNVGKSEFSDLTPALSKAPANFGDQPLQAGGVAGVKPAEAAPGTSGEGKPVTLTAAAPSDQPAPKAGDSIAPTPDPAAPPATPERAPAAVEQPKPDAPQAPKEDPTAGRKIIRSGEIEFEVDSFDTAVERIGKIVLEEQGYLSTTNSDKLPNGKVKGSVILRVKPERLDTLVLKLRGIGDLRTQRIGAQDVSKQYTDTESALRAAHAMYDRLLDIVKNGKGQVKDLLEAEKQLGIWREKIEQLTGEIRFYDNQVSLSTLTVTLFERDIKTPAFASETETVAMALETEKVEDAYAKARAAIADAKGRITASELKQFDAGQLGATISAQIPPDAADALLGRLKQLDGRVARFERQRTQTTSNGQSPVDPRAADPLKVKREEVTVTLTIYNLANIAPRRITNLTLVAPDVEEAYRNLISAAQSAGGRVLASQISKPRPDQSVGTIRFDVPADKADALLAILRAAGEVVKTDTAESGDTQNVTESKRGFSITVASLSAFNARETQQIQLAAASVPDAFSEVMNAAKTKDGRIVNSQLNEQDRQNPTGTIEVSVSREALPAIEQAMHKSAEVVSRVVSRSNDTENTVDSKVHFQITVSSADRLPAREVVQTQRVAANVADAFNAIRSGIPKGGRILVSELNEQDPQNVTAKLEFDVPHESDAAARDLLEKNSATLSRQVSRTPEGQPAVEKVRYFVVLASAEHQAPRQTVQMGVQVSDVEKATDDLVAAAAAAGGRQADNPTVSQDNAGHTTATVTLDVPLEKAQAIADQADHMGSRRSRHVTVDTHAPDTRLARARLEVTFSDTAAGLGGEASMGDYFRNGVMTSLKGLGYGLMFVVVGICLVLPLLLVIWAGVRFVRRVRRSGTQPPAGGAGPGAPAVGIEKA
ncbi:MAG TPA: DUF4349 domain-containing protein [Tepidisphaeraceae bacterium]|jgi:glycine cleavage system regulatory protein|nr:DUF4349 domain-containing protein [Tepidisphaeraceae bacterium]